MNISFSACFLAIFLLFGSNLSADGFSPPLELEERAARDSEWHFALALYGWAPEIDITLRNGIEFDLGLNDILGDLRAAAFVSMAASRGDWAFGVDAIYLDLAVDRTASGASDPILGNFTVAGDARVDVDVRTWIANPVVSYRIHQSDWGRLDALVGARYLHLEERVGLAVDGRLELNGNVLLSRRGYYQTTGSSDFWAGIAGLSGRLELGEAWHIPFYMDIGKGDPNLTWQVFLGIAREVNGVDFVLGYRHLDIDLGRSSGLSKLEAGGLMLGVSASF